MSSDPNQPSSVGPTQVPLYNPRHLANVAAALSEDRHPRQIGPYQILEPLGEGGMGIVYKAQQLTPIQRTVAIKVIKFGMDSRGVLARFESERRALALMDHPNVARVLDAGTTDTGRPYFVMEFVDGEPITSFADRNRLFVAQRLKLLIQACSALQHAHQKAIIHRDIKPSNILVTMQDGAPLVKVIDFGVAKAIEQTRAGQTIFTEVGQLIGTPEYMSPEQADGNRDIDTRSDVYSLGVVLFELLSGALPFDSKTLRAAGYGEVCRIIREVDPPRPSAKLSSLGAKATSVAERRQLLPSALVHQLRSELDWIVVKSLSKERESRYASPSELAEDLENYLENRPLRAGPESVIYRARKFVRRNKIGVVGSAAALGLLVLGTAATSWQAIRATRAEHATRLEQQKTLAEQQRTLEEKQKALDAQKRAEAANEASEQVNEFLTSMLQSVDPEFAQGQEVRVRDVLDKASDSVDSKFAGQPKIASALHSALGQTYASLGLLDKGDAHLQAAYDIDRILFGENSMEAMRSFGRLAVLRNMQDRIEDAYAMDLKSLEWARQTFGPDHRMTINAMVELGVVSETMGKVKEAEELLRSALAADQRTRQDNTEDHFITMGNLGQMLRQNGRLDEAEELNRRAYEGMAKLKGENYPTTLGMQGVYADVLRLKGALPQAEKIMRDYFDRAMKVFGPDHLLSIHPEQGLAVVLETEEKHDEALAHFRSAIARARKVLGSTNRETLGMIQSFAAARANAGEAEEANQLFHEAYEGWVKASGPDHPQAVIALYGLVQNLYTESRWSEAIGPAERLYRLLEDPNHIQIAPGRRARYLSAYGIVLAHLFRFEEAKGPLRFAYEALIKEDITGKGNLQAYHSVVSLLKGIAEHSDQPDEETFWEKEMSRYGPPPDYKGSLVWPTTIPTTQPDPSSATGPAL